MIFCESCGTPIQEGISKCPCCGALISSASWGKSGQSNAYGQSGPYNQPGNYGQPNAYGQPNPYNQPRGNGQPNAYGQSNPYSRPGNYGKPNSYGQGNMFGGNMNGMSNGMGANQTVNNALVNEYDKRSIDSVKNAIFGMAGIIMALIVAALGFIPLTSINGTKNSCYEIIKKYIRTFGYLEDYDGKELFSALWTLMIATLVIYSLLSIYAHAAKFILLHIINLCDNGNCYNVFINQTKGFVSVFGLQLLFIYNYNMKRGVVFWIYLAILVLMVITVLICGMTNVRLVEKEHKKNYIFQSMVNSTYAIIAFVGLFATFFGVMQLEGYNSFHNIGVNVVLQYFIGTIGGSEAKLAGVCCGILAILSIAAVFGLIYIIRQSIENVNRGIYADQSILIRSVYGIVLTIVIWILKIIVHDIDKVVETGLTGFQIILLISFILLLLVACMKLIVEANMKELKVRIVPNAYELNSKAIVKSIIEIGIIVVMSVMLVIIGICV